MIDEGYITCEDDWLNMRVGARGTVLSNGLIGVNADHNRRPAVVVGIADWDQLLINTPSLPPEVVGSLLRASGGFFFIRVRRTEDGLEGIALWQRGGVPIPLTSGSLTDLSNEGGLHEQA